jgi:hypothetical protein
MRELIRHILKESNSEKYLKKLFKITKMIMEDMILPEYNHLICSYEITLNEVFNIPEVTVLFIGGYGTKLWPMTQGIRQMYLDVLEDISKEIANYTGVVIGVRGEQTPKCDDKENIYLRESKTEDKEYSPAGKEIIPNEKVFHQSNPMFRNKIEEQGLKVRAGECYKIYAGYGEKCIPAIFATNSSNKRAWFDSSYDDDVWEIDTTKIPNVKWYKDRHYESRSKHIVTFQDIPKEAIKLIYEGSGKDGGIMESVDKSENKKLKLITKMIHDFFDDVSFIDIKKYENKPMIRVYFNNDEDFGNEEIYFAEQIQDKIYEYTGIKLVPYWHTIQYNTDADFRLDAIKLKYDNEGNVINESESLNESDNRETDKKLKLVKEMIYSLFDEVEFIEVDTNYEGKPLIKIYHDVEDTAANYDNWFTHRIIDEIMEMTGDGIILSPYWAARWDWKYKNADFYIDVEKIEYDNEGNVISESENKQERKFNKLVQKIEDYLNSNEYPSVKKFTVYYEDTHDDVIVNIFFNVQDSIKLGGGINSVIKRVGKQVMEDLEVFPMDFKYYIHFDRDINESSIKEKSLVKLIEKDGLYDFIEMTGLDFNQVRSLIKQIDNPKKIIKQYIRQFVIEDDPNSGENSGVLIGVEIPLSNTKYVNDIMVQDSDQIAVEIFEFGQDEYGHTEQKDQYLTTINNLTNDELLSILSWMMETIQNGYRD